MLRSFQNLLVSLNHTSGKRIWWIPYTIGMSLIAIWIGAALPWADLITGSMVGIGQFGGAGSVTTMIAYGHEITSITADFYFLAVFFGIAMMTGSLLLAQVSGSFARGYKYNYRPVLGILGGIWFR